MSSTAAAQRARPGDPDRNGSRAALLEAAATLMTERDTLAVPISDIAREAGLNSALIKFYFGNKAGMMLALLQRDLADAVDELRAHVKTDLRPELKMKYHLSGLIRMYFRHPYLQRLLIATMRDEPPEVAREIAERYLKPIADAYEEMIGEGVDAGDFKKTDARLFYFTAIGACDQIFSARFVLRYVHGIDAIDDDLRRAYVEQTVSLIMRGLLARP